MRMKQYFLTPAEGKKCIARGIAALESVRRALDGHKILIVAGTTNAYVARALLEGIGDAEGFDPYGFYRGITVPKGRKPKHAPPIGDVLIENGRWVRGADVFAAAETLGAGDVLLKGANAVNLEDGEAAILIGHPQGGTAVPVIGATVGRRVRCIVPVGVEKRVTERVARLAACANDPEAEGPRLLPVPGQVFTELDAMTLLTGVRPRILAAGGVLGAEGGCYFACQGDEAALSRMDALAGELAAEPEIGY